MVFTYLSRDCIRFAKLRVPTKRLNVNRIYRPLDRHLGFQALMSFVPWVSQLRVGVLVYSKDSASHHLRHYQRSEKLVAAILHKPETSYSCRQHSRSAQPSLRTHCPRRAHQASRLVLWPLDAILPPQDRSPGIKIFGSTTLSALLSQYASSSGCYTRQKQMPTPMSMHRHRSSPSMIVPPMDLSRAWP